MKGIYFYLLISLSVCNLTSCGQSNQSKLTNKWLIVGTLENGVVKPEGGKKKEYEFLKGNKVNIYENGAIEGTGTYTFASDQKSVLLKIEDESLSLKIIKLTANELRWVINMSHLSKDTFVSYPSNSTLAKSMAGKVNAEAWNEIAKAWNKVNIEYQRRSDLVANLVALLKGEESFDEKTIEELVAARKKATDFNIKPEDLTVESVLEYQLAQARLGSSLRRAFVKVEEKSELKKLESMQQMQIQIKELENRIIIAIKDYNDGVAAYNEAAKTNNSPQKDIAFKVVR